MISNLIPRLIEETTFIVVDFETITPKGRSPEPIELGAMRIEKGLRVDPNFEISWYIKPPIDLKITSFDTRQTGIHMNDVLDAPSAEIAILKFDELISNKDYMFIAQNARYEASIISRLSKECKYIKDIPFIDTIVLAKNLIPNLPNYKLDTLASYFSISIPNNRHRALPDVKLTVQVFLNLIIISKKNKKNIIYNTDLYRIAGIKNKTDTDIIQLSLFD